MQVEKHKCSSGDHTFSIIIPSWNNLSYLKMCISSIRKHSHYSHQLIVHINEGIDGTKGWIEKDGGIDYTCSNQNIGICYALNAARTLMDTDYLVYMNDDMYVCPGWDHELLKEIKQIGHSRFFLSATAIEPEDTGNDCVIVKDFGKELTNFKETALLAEFAGLPMQDWQGSTWPPNIVHRDLWDLVGGYSVEFTPGFYSDPDFSMKLWNAGVRLFKGVGQSRVYHFGSKSTKRSSKNKGYNTFIKKWGISSGTFTCQYLQRGKPFSGSLSEPVENKLYELKNFFKRIVSGVQQ